MFVVGIEGFVGGYSKIRLPLSSTTRAFSPRYSIKMTLSQQAVDESIPVEHRGVPAEHQGLHSTLYADGDDHGASEQATYELVLSDVSLPIEKFIELSKGKKAAGVFSISGPDGTTKFISFSRNLHLSVSGWLPVAN